MSMQWMQQYLGGAPAVTGNFGFQMPAALGQQYPQPAGTELAFGMPGLSMLPGVDQYMQPGVFGGGDYNGLNEMNNIVAQVAAETQQLMAQLQASQAQGQQSGGIQGLLGASAGNSPLSGFGSVNDIMAMARTMQPQSTGSTAKAAQPEQAATAGSASNGSLAEQRKAALDEAQQYVGLNEYDNNDQLQAWLGRNTQGKDNAWCALMVTKMLEKHGGSPWPYTEWVPNITQWGKDNGKYFGVGQGTPNVGDAAIFGNSDHVGFVKEVKPDGTIVTIEGNADSAVKENTYSPGGDGWLTGFVKTS